MKRILVLVFFIYSGLLYSQKLEFIEKRDTLQKPKYQQFIFISDKTDISESIFVAKIKSTGSLKKVSDLYLMIKDAAQRKGANSFKFESFKKIDSENGELILSAYYVEGSFFDINFENLPKNKIYIFGNQNLLENKTQSYKVKSEKYEIENGKYKVFDINESEDIKINKGGFTGMTLWISRKEGEFSNYLSFSGIGLNEVGYQPYGGGIGVSINTGTINRVEPNLALALLQMYTLQK